MFGQIIATSTEVALNDTIRKGIPPNPLNSGLGNDSRLPRIIMYWVVVSNIFDFHFIWVRFPFWLIYFKGVETTNQFIYLPLVDFSGQMLEFPDVVVAPIHDLQPIGSDPVATHTVLWSTWSFAVQKMETLGDHYRYCMRVWCILCFYICGQLGFLCRNVVVKSNFRFSLDFEVPTVSLIQTRKQKIVPQTSHQRPPAAAASACRVTWHITNHYKDPY